MNLWLALGIDAIYLAGAVFVKKTFTNPDRFKEDLLAVTWPVSLPVLIAFSRKKDS